MKFDDNRTTRKNYQRNKLTKINYDQNSISIFQNNNIIIFASDKT